MAGGTVLLNPAPGVHSCPATSTTAPLPACSAPAPSCRGVGSQTRGEDGALAVRSPLRQEHGLPQ